MTHNAEDKLKAAVAVLDAKRSGDYWLFKCPLHDDRCESGSLSRGASKAFVVKCHRGCDQSALYSEVQSRVDDYLKAHGHPPKRTKSSNGKANGQHPPSTKFVPITEYGYTDALGEVQFVAVRGEQGGAKTFRQKRRKPDGRYEWKGPAKTDRVPFNLVAVNKAIAEGKPILFVEGEKDVVRLAGHGLTATCNIGGAGKWGKEESACLAGADLVMLADNDVPGQKHRADAARLLAGTVSGFRFVDLPGLPEGGDVSDWLDAGGGMEALCQLINRAPEWHPKPPKPPTGIADTLIVKEATQRGRFQAHWAVKPAADAVETAVLLSLIKDCIEAHIVLPKHGGETLALWVLHSWLFDAFDVSPFILVVSPTKQCGKTTLLILLQWLTPRSVMASNISASSLFRFVEANQPTMIVDEADSFVNGNEEMRGILNSGHTKAAAFVVRNVDVKGEYIPTPFSTWCSKVIASIGRLADTLMDRGFRIQLRRKKRGEKKKRRPLRDRKEFQTLRSKLARWAQDNIKAMDGYEPDCPKELYNREWDNWIPLYAIAELAGPDWVKAVINAAKAQGDGSEYGDPKLDLLSDIRGIMKRGGPEDFWSSTNLAATLREDDEKQWSTYGRSGKGLTAHSMARLLGEFGIRSLHHETGNGYRKRQFKDAWEEYITPE